MNYSQNVVSVIYIKDEAKVSNPESGAIIFSDMAVPNVAYLLPFFNINLYVSVDMGLHFVSEKARAADQDWDVDAKYLRLQHRSNSSAHRTGYGSKCCRFIRGQYAPAHALRYQ